MRQVSILSIPSLSDQKPSKSSEWCHQPQLQPTTLKFLSQPNTLKFQSRGLWGRRPPPLPWYRPPGPQAWEHCLRWKVVIDNHCCDYGWLPDQLKNYDWLHFDFCRETGEIKIVDFGTGWSSFGRMTAHPNKNLSCILLVHKKIQKN